MNQLTDFTFRDTGITVKIRKVSPMLAGDIANAFPEPDPPSQEVDYGEGRGVVMEKNYSDPNYAHTLAEYRKELSMKLQRAMIMRAVVVEGDEWRAEAQEYRDFMRSQGVELDEPEELVVYVLRVCVGSEDDLTDLLTAITRRSQPTQEAVERAKANFRGDVPGA